jgi:hypothetical protein
MPLRLNREETVPREERRPHLDAPTVRHALLTHPREIRCEPRQPKTMERKPLTARLQPCARPVSHDRSPPRPERAPTRYILRFRNGADRRQRVQFVAAIMVRARNRARIARRVEKLALDRPQNSVGTSRTNAWNTG